MGALESKSSGELLLRNGKNIELSSIQASAYSGISSKNAVASWYVNTLVAGLRTNANSALDALETDINANFTTIENELNEIKLLLAFIGIERFANVSTYAEFLTLAEQPFSVKGGDAVMHLTPTDYAVPLIDAGVTIAVPTVANLV
jgi:hypothetical protein